MCDECGVAEQLATAVGVEYTPPLPPLHSGMLLTCNYVGYSYVGLMVLILDVFKLKTSAKSNLTLSVKSDYVQMTTPT